MTDPMPSESLEVSVEDDGVIVVAGDIDLASGPILARVLADLDPTTVPVLDLSRVGFIDSSGLRTLLVASRDVSDRGATLVIRSPSAAVARLLEITETTSQFTVEP